MSLLLVALLLGWAPESAAAPGPAVSGFAAPTPGVPSASAAALGLRRVEGEGVLVFHFATKERLAGEIAATLAAMLQDARGLTGLRLSSFGLVLVGSRSELSPSVGESRWLNVDGVPCLVLPVPEPSLPLRDPLSAHLAFPLMVHEAVDVGLKDELFGGGLTQATVSSRWIIEGVAEYAAYRAVSRHQPGSFAWSKGEYLHALRARREPFLDLESVRLWWPFAGAMPQHVSHAYGAAHFAVAELSRPRGDAWIRRTLDRLRTGGPFTSEEFRRAAALELGSDPGPFLRAVPTGAVLAFAEALAP